MRQYFLFAFALLLINVASFSQGKHYLYYFDKELSPVKKEKAVFNGIGVYENGLLELRLYNISQKNLVIVEHFTDSSLQLNDGFFQSFYPGSFKEWSGNYSKGKQNGLWQHWDEFGHTIDSSFYNNGDKVIVVHYGYFKNGQLDSFIVNDIKKDQLQETYYDSTGKLLSEIGFTGQKGLVKRYKSGVIANTDSVFTREEIEASFPGGASVWSHYIATQIEKRQDEFTNKDYGTCIVKFIVGMDGKVTDVAAVNMLASKLAEVAINAIRKGPNWIPARQYGRPVKAYRLQPVTLGKPR
jgi:antitoxin component YwqK of YwqJK toxin-antitoxin module